MKILPAQWCVKGVFAFGLGGLNKTISYHAEHRTKKVYLFLRLLVFYWPPLSQCSFQQTSQFFGCPAAAIGQENDEIFEAGK